MTTLPDTWHPRSPAAAYAEARQACRDAPTTPARLAALTELRRISGALGFAACQRLDAELDALEERTA